MKHNLDRHFCSLLYSSSYKLSHRRTVSFNDWLYISPIMGSVNLDSVSCITSIRLRHQFAGRFEDCCHSCAQSAITFPILLWTSCCMEPQISWFRMISWLDDCCLALLHYKFGYVYQIRAKTFKTNECLTSSLSTASALLTFFLLMIRFLKDIVLSAGFLAYVIIPLRLKLPLLELTITSRGKAYLAGSLWHFAHIHNWNSPIE